MRPRSHRDLIDRELARAGIETQIAMRHGDSSLNVVIPARIVGIHDLDCPPLGFFTKIRMLQSRGNPADLMEHFLFRRMDHFHEPGLIVSQALKDRKLIQNGRQDGINTLGSGREQTERLPLLTQLYSRQVEEDVPSVPVPSVRVPSRVPGPKHDISVV